jgi:hypothetical protein
VHEQSAKSPNGALWEGKIPTKGQIEPLHVLHGCITSFDIAVAFANSPWVVQKEVQAPSTLKIGRGPC